MVDGMMECQTSVMSGWETMKRKSDKNTIEDAELPIVGTKISCGTVAGSRAGLDLGTSGLRVVLGRRPGRLVFCGAKERKNSS